MPPADHPACRAYAERTGHPHPLVEHLARVAPAPPPRISLPVRLAVGSNVYDLGTVAGCDHAELSEELAVRCEELARMLRGPEHSPAPPCSACGAERVYRRGHSAAFITLPAGRDAEGAPVRYGVHYAFGPGCVGIDEYRARTVGGS